jgi:hypothetical protein
MKTQAPLIWSDGVVKLNPVTCIHPYISGVIHPRDFEDENPVRLYYAFQYSGFIKFRMFIVNFFNT